MRCVLLMVLACFVSPVVAGDTARLESGPAAKGITAPELLAHLRFLASDFMSGRDTGSEHEKLASEYLAAHLSAIGLAPCGDVVDGKASYFAEFPLRRIQPSRERTRVSLTYSDDDVSRTVHLSAATDFVISPRGLEPGATTAPVAFAGGGVVNSERNDYEGADVKGKFALVEMESVSGGRRGSLSFGAIRALRNNATKAGAIGLLVIRAKPEVAEGAEGDEGAAEPKSFGESLSWAKRSFGRSSLLLGDGTEVGDDAESKRQPTIPVMYLESAGTDFVREAGKLQPLRRGQVSGLTASFEYAADITPIRSRNVVAVLPGSDPTLSKEVLVYSAHYDHVGVNAKGEIFNGADDNASGTCAILEVAQAYSEAPAPKRTVVFLWVSGEEKGLLGSEWWAGHDTLPEGHEIVGNLNMDMVGRNDSGKISICPSPEHDGHSTMGKFLAEACSLENYTAVYDADRFYRRTDSYNFAKLGIPFVFFFSGEHEDYHRPSDTIDKVDADKAASVARIAYHLGFELANRAERPRINEKKSGEGTPKE